MKIFSIDGEIEKLRKQRNRELHKNSEKRFVRMMKVYLSFYNIPQRRFSKTIDVSHIVLNKVLNGQDELVSITQWDNTIEKMMKIDLQNLFDDMNNKDKLEAVGVKVVVT